MIESFMKNYLYNLFNYMFYSWYRDDINNDGGANIGGGATQQSQ